jgi:hypothetical protein
VVGARGITTSCSAGVNVPLPRLCDLAMRNRRLLPYHKRVVGSARDQVLDIGVGSGLNLPLYGAARGVMALEPAPGLIAMVPRSGAVVPVTFIGGRQNRFQSTTRPPVRPLRHGRYAQYCARMPPSNEMCRVLRWGARLVFVEHGFGPEANVRRWQDRSIPLWRGINVGCHLNRPIRDMIEDSGFRLERLETSYIPGLKILNFTYKGRAVPT